MKKVFLCALLLCLPLLSHAASNTCTARMKEGPWTNVKLDKKIIETPISNIYVSAVLGTKLIAGRLDDLTPASTPEQFIEAVGEKPSRQPDIKSGNGSLIWEFESMGEKHSIMVTYTVGCIFQIMISSSTSDGIKVLRQKNEILSL